MGNTDAKNEELVDRLAGLPPFRVVARQHLLLLAQKGRLRPMATGEAVVSFGQRPTEVSLVLSGSLHHLEADGRLGGVSARPGDCAGFTTVFTRATPATRTLVAGPGTTCLVFDPEWLSEQRGNLAVVALELASLGDLTRRMATSNREAKRMLQRAAQQQEPEQRTGEPPSDTGGLWSSLRSLFGGAS